MGHAAAKQRCCLEAEKMQLTSAAHRFAASLHQVEDLSNLPMIGFNVGLALARACPPLFGQLPPGVHDAHTNLLVGPNQDLLMHKHTHFIAIVNHLLLSVSACKP